MDNNKKNLILISDQNGACIDSVLSTGLYNIKLIVVPYKKNVEALKLKYGNIIENYLYYIPDTNSEFQSIFYTDYDLNYEDVEKYRSTQLKCFRYNSRFIIDDNMNNCIYYTALKYFLHYFKNNSIDCVFSRIIEHGAISDTLIFDIAKNNNIPVYLLSLSSSFGNYVLYSLLDYNNKSFIDISKINKCIPNLDEYLSVLDKNYGNNRILRFPFSKLIKKFFNKKKKTLKQCIAWLYKYKIKFYLDNFKKTSINDLYKIREEVSFFQILSGHLYLKKLKKFYFKHSTNICEGENFVFFPLHMEPEAATMARATMNCQLFMIEQIAKKLPDNWFLYVKEHPDQFYQVQFDKYMHKSVLNFRNIDFYKRISKIDKVRLININVSSSELISKSKAITSIAGSSLIESIAKKKPIIIWGDGCTVVELLKDALVVNKTSDFGVFIKKVCNNFTPKYDDYVGIVDKYLFDIDYKEFYKTNDTISDIFKLIYKL